MFAQPVYAQRVFAQPVFARRAFTERGTAERATDTNVRWLRISACLNFRRAWGGTHALSPVRVPGWCADRGSRHAVQEDPTQ